MILKAYKYRIYPDAKASQQLAQHFGAVRFVYNTALDLRQRYYQQFAKGISKRSVQDQFVALKKTPEFDWLNTINSQAILAALGHVHTAYQNFFRGTTRHPKFKSRKSGWQSFQAPQHVKVNFDMHCIQLPKIGWIKANLHRDFVGNIKTCTIKRNPAGHYYISVLVETPDELPIKSEIHEESTRGIDLGIKDFAIYDTGDKVANPRFLQINLARLGIEQKKLSRRKKGSNRRDKQKRGVARKYLSITNHRNNFLHQTSSALLRDSQAETVALEDLNLKGMIRNRKLSRHIADVAWGRFVEMLRYKAEWSGKNILFCNRFAPSTKTCSCGAVNHNLTLSDREWDCPEY